MHRFGEIQRPLQPSASSSSTSLLQTVPLGRVCGSVGGITRAALMSVIGLVVSLVAFDVATAQPLQGNSAIPRSGADPRIQQQSPQASQPSLLPRPFPELNADHQQYLDQLLAYWEHSSGQIEMFECKFNRWVYDPVFGPKRDANGELPAKSISKGAIKFKAPDKGLFFVENIWEYRAPQNPEENPYQIAEMQEKWICDGSFVFEYDYANKKLIKRELPPELKGQGLVNGPLPFLFGAKKDDLQARYWLRVITPQEVTGEYWLEAYPKYPADARNYQKVVVILDEKDFLPKATELFDPNFNAQTNPARTVFEFEKREIFKANSLSLDALTRRFGREFFEPKPERGWEEIVQPYRETAAQPQGDAARR